jgi:hypothetical protein
LRRWAASSPESFRHRHLLIEAEWHRALGRFSRAAAVYTDAIAVAKQNGFVQDAALGDELAAEMHTARGDEDLAGMHLRAALGGYREWGATAKVEDLLARYPRVRSSS